MEDSYSPLEARNEGILCERRKATPSKSILRGRPRTHFYHRSAARLDWALNFGMPQGYGWTEVGVEEPWCVVRVRSSPDHGTGAQDRRQLRPVR